jgi:transcriptional regulator with XRE-family HTH domain
MAAKPHAELARRMLIGLHGLELEEGPRISYAEIARRMGEIAAPAPQVSTIQRWFTGAQSPDTRQQMAALASVLGVDPGWLTYGDPENREAARAEDPPFLGPLPKAPFGEPPDAARRRKRDGR